MSITRKMADMEYFVPDGSERIESDEHYILGATWGSDDEEGGLVPTLSEAKVFEFNFENEDYRYWLIRNVGQMCLAAREAAYEDATSYRGMKVGVSIMALSFDKSRIAFLSQGNHKANEEDSTNCGEYNLLMATTEILGYDHIAAFCIAGPNQHQKAEHGEVVSILGKTVMPSKTLFPCFRCDGALEGSYVVTPRTEIITLPKHLDYFQHQTQKEYHDRQRRYEETGSYDESDVYRFMPSPDIWRENAEIYKILRDRRNLKGSDYDDLQKRKDGRSKLISKTLHITSVHHPDNQ